MKKNLLVFVFAFVLTMAVNAQTLFEHDFEDGFGDIILVDNDGNTPAGNVSTYVDAWNLRDADFGQAAISNSWYAPAAAADDWMILPEIDIPEAGFSFLFDVRAVDPNYADGYEVLVSTTDTELESFTSLFSTGGESTAWVKRSVSLDDYAGEKIYLAIRNNSFDKFLLIVDNLLVVKLAEKDIAADRLTNKRWNLVNDVVYPTFTLENKGSETINSVDVEYTINGDVKNETVSGLNIASFETGEVEVSEGLTLSEANQYDVTFEFSNPNGGADTDDTDNMGAGPINALSELPSRKVVGEEGTGTWCPWCPRGEVFLNAAIEDHPDDFIGIAVHNGDPMTVAEYDDNVGFSAYPSLHLNREVRDIDPSEIEDFFEGVKNTVVPFGADMDLTYDENTRLLTVVAKAMPMTTINGGDFRFALVLTEDGLSGTTNAWAQANAYAGNTNGPMGGYENLPNPVPASQMVYSHVGRVLVDGYFGVEGSIASSLVAGEEITHTFEYTIPESMDPMMMDAVVMILESETASILNADKQEIQMFVNTNETLTEIASSIYPNPASAVAQVELNLEVASEVNITIMDVTGKVVASRDYGTVQGNQVFPIQVTNFTNGMYMVHITTDNGVSTKRLMVTK